MAIAGSDNIISEKDLKERGLHGSLDFYQVLQEMAELHSRKSHDYATIEDPFKNYRFAGEIGSLFSHPADIGFVCRLAEKIMRLAVLQDKTPLNESVEDTEKDIAVITALWMAERRDRRRGRRIEEFKTLPEDKHEG
jgi:hypothetical protein